MGQDQQGRQEPLCVLLTQVGVDESADDSLAATDLPFGAGRHRCIGEAFAMLQISTIVATLVRETRWVLDSPGKFPKNDYTVRLSLACHACSS